MVKVAKRTELPHVAGFDPNRLQGDYVYDEEKGDRAVSFFSDVLQHVKNSRFTKAGDPFTLEPWQQDIVRLMFGCADRKGLRRFRQSYVEIPRKNGKTSLCAGIAIYGLYCDKEAGAECYCAAATRDQASLLFDLAAGMVRKSEILLNAPGSKIKQSIKRINYGDSYLRAVASDAHGLHGQHAHMVLADEVHAWVQGGHELWDTLETGTAARGQALMIGITTAGHDKESKCYELHQYAEGVRDGKIDDPTFLPVVYGAQPGDDWTDPEVWAKANPNLNVSIPIEYLKQKCHQAQANPSFENTFKRLHLNMWTQQRTRWLNMEAWDQCGQVAT